MERLPAGCAGDRGLSRSWPSTVPAGVAAMSATPRPRGLLAAVNEQVTDNCCSGCRMC